MFNNAVLGLKFLKNSYSTYATIQHTLDYYIIILMQKNTAVMSKMGISTIDIERLTQTLLDSNSASASASISISLQNESPIPNNNSNNNSNEKGKNKDTRDIARDIARDTEKESRGKDSKDKKSEPKEQKEHDALQHKQNEKQNEKQQDKLDMELHMQMRDIHKFLFELWNEREMGIVINLYREMETKQPGTERNYIYNNIMQYCEMKENKLYKYIEQNSSIL
jgi:hypothetical protein